MANMKVEFDLMMFNSILIHVRNQQCQLEGQDSRGQLEGLRDQPEDLGASQRVWKVSQGVWRVKLGRGSGKTKKLRNVETVD